MTTTASKTPDQLIAGHSKGASYKIVQDVPINEFNRAKIDGSVHKLKKEKARVSELIK